MNRRKILAGVALVIVGLAMSASPLWAHHPIITAQTACTKNGFHRVAWSIGNSEPARVMTITSATAKHAGTSYPVLGYSTHVPPSGTTNAHSFLPGNLTGNVTLTVTATWPDGAHAKRAVTIPLGPACGSTTTTTKPTTTTTKPTTTTSSPSTTSTSTSTTVTTATTTPTTSPSTTTSTEPEPTTSTTIRRPHTPPPPTIIIGPPTELPRTGGGNGLLPVGLTVVGIGGALLLTARLRGVRAR